MKHKSSKMFLIHHNGIFCEFNIQCPLLNKKSLPPLYPFALSITKPQLEKTTLGQEAQKFTPIEKEEVDMTYK